MITLLDAMKSGFSELNGKLLAGAGAAKFALRGLSGVVSLHAGTVTVVAGRPGVGKTAFCLDLVRKNVMRRAPDDEDAPEGVEALLISPAARIEDIAMRLNSMESMVPLQAFVEGNLNEQAWNRLTMSASALGAARLRISDSPRPDIKSVASTTAEFASSASRKRVPLVVIDYVQLIRPLARRQNRYEELCDVTQELKAIALELRCALVVVSQLNRNVEHRGGLPVLSDLRDSGTLEDDADAIIFLAEHRETPVIIAKNRFGAVGPVDAYFYREVGLWVDLEPEESAPTV